MSFSEFMRSMEKGQFVELLLKDDFAMVTTFKQEYIELLKYYYFVGGMPEVVSRFAESKDFNVEERSTGRILRIRMLLAQHPLPID